MNYYQNFNPYFQPQLQPQAQRFQTPDQQYVQQMQNQVTQPTYKPVGLQGKSVDSLDVVKAMDIPLDGSISYFPLVDGTAIVTKQLQADGTSKTLIYKPIEVEEESKESVKYITMDELTDILDENQKVFKDEIKELKKKIKKLNRDDEED